MDPSPPPPARRILLTGSAGAIGRCIGPALLNRGHDVRGFDLHPTPGLHDHAVGSLTDEAALDRAMHGRDTLIHLAANPYSSSTLAELVKPNILGLRHTLQAAVAHGVSRLVIASTMQVISGVEARGDAPVATDERAPMNDYALTKVWAEEAGMMLARRHVVSVLLARIGWFPRNAREWQHLATSPKGPLSYFSPGDACRFFTAAAESDLRPPGGKRGAAAVVYAVGPTPRYDLKPGRRLIGYEPQDTFPTGTAFPGLPTAPEQGSTLSHKSQSP